MLSIIEAMVLAAAARMSLGDAQVLLAHLLGRSRTWVIANPTAQLSEELAQQFTQLVLRAADGEPLAYLTGEREFYRLPFTITPAVLVPRPETEHLVEAALGWIRERTKVSIDSPDAEPPIIHAVDVGTGSGIIAISLAAYAPAVRVVGVDASTEALAVAQENAERLRVKERVRFVRGDLLSALTGPFDLLAANLPYIPTDELDGLPVSRWEPRTALDGGPDGLDAIRALLKQAPTRLALGGLLLLEIGYDQGEAVTNLCREAFPDAEIIMLHDLAGYDRVVQVQA